MKQDNRGITLVELIIAVTISLVIMGAATVFIRSAEKGFTNASNTIDLQMESQVLMEQISKWVMESNGVKVEGNKLILYSIPRKVDYADLPDGMSIAEKQAKYPQESTKRVIWEKDGRLYMKEFSGITNPDTDTTPDASLVAEEKCCVGDYVSGFTPILTYVANPSTQTEQPKVKITLKMAEGSEIYELENEFTLRNEWLLAWEGGKRYEEVA